MKLDIALSICITVVTIASGCSSPLVKSNSPEEITSEAISTGIERNRQPNTVTLTFSDIEMKGPDWVTTLRQVKVDAESLPAYPGWKWNMHFLQDTPVMKAREEGPSWQDVVLELTLELSDGRKLVGNGGFSRVCRLEFMDRGNSHKDAYPIDMNMVTKATIRATFKKRVTWC